MNLQKASDELSRTVRVAACLLIFAAIVPLGSEDVWYEAAAVAAIFLLSALWRSANGSAYVETRRLLLPVFALAFYALLQGLIPLLSGSGAAAGFNLAFDPVKSIWSGFKIAAFAFFLQLLFVSFRRRLRLLVWCLLLIGNFFAVFGIARFLLQPANPEVFSYLVSDRLAANIGFGTYFNQNHFAYLMLMAFGLAIGLFWYGRLARQLRFLLFTVALVMWTALVLTGSRGGIIAAFAEISILVFLPLAMPVLRRKRAGRPVSKVTLAARRLMILLFAFGILILGIVLIGQDRVVERFEDIPQQIEGVTAPPVFRRVDVWEAALPMFRDYPVFGVGFGGFQFAVSQYIDISGERVPKQAHNDYLELADSGGIVAIGLGLWFLFQFFSLIKMRLGEPADAFSFAARLGAVCGIAGIAFHSFFDFGLQIFANALYFAALIFVAVHQSESQAETNDAAGAARLTPATGFLSLAAVMAAGAALLFGFAEYKAEQARALPSQDFLNCVICKVPFDADYFDARSDVYRAFGDLDTAKKVLADAAALRPMDYALWLKAANLFASQNDTSQADAAYRRAVDLAPYYAEPSLMFGRFLVKSDRKERGYALLRFAAGRNPKYFDEVLKLAWDDAAGNSAAAITRLSPLDGFQKSRAIAFLMDKGDFGAITQLACREEDLTAADRDSLVESLLEKRAFRAAGLINSRNCNELVTAQVENGGFASLHRSTGFGWRIRSSGGNTTFAIEPEGSAEHGLILNFNGREEAAALVSQIIVVEKMRKYRLRFSYKTKDIVTGGVPALQVILRDPKSEKVAESVALSPDRVAWVQTSVDFQTDELTEAIEIRLVRLPCAEGACPIFGKLWLDDFGLAELK